MNDPVRPDPDELLAAIQRDEAANKRGRLKVFLGMCPGVGKTYAMLEAARRELANGRDVVIGLVETHGRKETAALVAGIPEIPRMTAEYRGMQLKEFDLDAALARKPSVLLVDELAHTNAPGVRHQKRFHDVLELLQAGIDVYSTLNVQHIESRADAVRQITGAAIHETVPDTLLADAELELVDLPPEELRTRMAEGKVYVAERAATAGSNFFRPGNLSALRELALRFCAEHVGQDVREYRREQGIVDPWKSGQRLLVAVSSSPTSASLVRWACRLAGELKSPWVAVYVEQPRATGAEEQKQLADNLELARQLGAEVITTTDEELLEGILRVAREQNVTQLVVGKPLGWRSLDLLRGGSFLNRLIRASGNIDVHIVRAESLSQTRFARAPIAVPHIVASDGVWCAAVVSSITLLGLLVKHWTGYQSIALLYLMGVALLGLVTRRGAVLVAAMVSAGLWNFLFVPPIFTLSISNTHDWILFMTLLLVGVVVGQLTARMRAQQMAERTREQRATALYLLTRDMAEATDFPQLLAVIVSQFGEVFRARVGVSLPSTEEAGKVTPYFAGSWTLPDKELGVANWSLQNGEAAGAGTDTLSSSEGLHLPLLAGKKAVGVISLRFAPDTRLNLAEKSLLDAFVRQAALVLDRQRLQDFDRQARLLTESERLGKTLLNSVSHELRTPLSAITTIASGLRDAGPLNAAQDQLAHELEEASARLNRLVRNLLDLSRLRAGHLHARLDWHDLRDLIQSSWQTVGRGDRTHPFTVAIPHGFPPVKLDAVLTEQILVNLLSNAVAHTPAGTPVEVSARAEGSTLTLEVADQGPGIEEAECERLFDHFQRGVSARAGGVGLGLAIVRGFAEAQGGTASVHGRQGGGAIFRIELPLAKMPSVPEDKE